MLDIPIPAGIELGAVEKRADVVDLDAVCDGTGGYRRRVRAEGEAHTAFLGEGLAVTRRENLDSNTLDTNNGERGLAESSRDGTDHGR